MSTDYSSSQGLISIDGLASGLDISGILDQIRTARSGPIRALEARRQDLQDRLSLYQTLETYVLSLQTAAQTVAASSTFQAREVSVSQSPASSTSVLVASADAGAPVGTYEIVVQQLAQVQKIRSDSFTSSSEALGLAGDFLVNGSVVHVASDDSLADVAAAINNADAGVQAAVVHVSDNDYRLLLTGLQTGASNALDLVDASASGVLEGLGLVQSATSIKHAITNGAASDQMASSTQAVGDVLELESPPSGTVQINGTDVAMDLSVDSLQDLAQRINATVTGVTASVETVGGDGGGTEYRLTIVGDTGTPSFTDDNNVLAALGVLTKPVAHEIQAAQDSQITLDGQTITRSTNSLDDVLDGLHLQLQAAAPSTTVTVTVANDLDATVSAVQDLVSKYNDVINFIAQNEDFDADTGTGGAFLGDWDVTRLESALRSAFTAPIEGLSSAYTLASQVGISSDQSDHLSVNETELREALASDPQAVARLFGVTAEATSSAVSYVSSTRATQSSGTDGYAVVITTPASRARVQSAELASGITVDETLTFNSEWTAHLYAGMSLEEAAEALNDTFELAGMAVTATVQGNRLVLEHNLYGSDYGFTVASSLDQGAGGTDLGGALAGDPASYTGVDVAGTIGGEEATGDGQYLTGKDDNEHTAGLRLKVTAQTAGNYGVVHFSKGLGQRLVDTIAGLEDPTQGTFARLTESINDQIEAVNDDLERLNDSLDSYLDRMRRSFIAMESALARAQAMSEYMSNQIAGLMRNTSGSSNGLGLG